MVRLRDQHRDVEIILQKLGSFERALVTAIDQDHAVALEADERYGGHGLCGGGQERSHFGRGLGGLVRPSGHFTNIDEGQRAVGGFGSGFLEHRNFLGAGNRQVAAVRQ